MSLNLDSYLKLSLREDISIYYLLNARGEIDHPFLPSLIIENERFEYYYRIEAHYKDGLLFNESDPAIKFFSFLTLDKTFLSKVIYHQKFILAKKRSLKTEQSIKNIASSIYHDHVDESVIFYLQNTFMERIDQDCPSVIDYHENGEIKKLQWFKDDKMHRLGGPAILKYNDKKMLLSSGWVKEGLFHREDGPSQQCFDFDNSVYYLSKEAWMKEGKEHREDGPAVIYYNSSSKVKDSFWWLEGKRLEEK